MTENERILQSQLEELKKKNIDLESDRRKKDEERWDRLEADSKKKHEMLINIQEDQSQTTLVVTGIKDRLERGDRVMAEHQDKIIDLESDQRALKNRVASHGKWLKWMGGIATTIGLGALAAKLGLK